MNKYGLLHHKKSESDKRLLRAGDIVGWIGAALLISAYLLASMDKLDGQSMVYQLLNLFGSACMVFLAVVRTAIPNAVANTIWAVISIVTIINLIAH
jgi:hypothetical protein